MLTIFVSFKCTRTLRFFFGPICTRVRSVKDLRMTFCYYSFNIQNDKQYVKIRTFVYNFFVPDTTFQGRVMQEEKTRDLEPLFI